eukprot:3169055-Prymnesium_polylepis.2
MASHLYGAEVHRVGDDIVVVRHDVGVDGVREDERLRVAQQLAQQLCARLEVRLGLRGSPPRGARHARAARHLHLWPLRALLRD